MDLLTFSVLTLNISIIAIFIIFRLAKKNAVKNVLMAEMKIENFLSRVIQSTFIDRAVLCKIHNGGGDIILGTEKKLSILIEPNNSLIPHTKKEYTSIPIDNAYQKVILHMLEHSNFVFHRATDLPPGLFRSKVNADKIKGILHFHLYTHSKGVYYAFLGTTQDPDLLLSSKTQMGYIEQQILLMKKEVNKSVKKVF